MGLQDYTWKICRADILMDTTNGHDKSLVKKINELWNSGKRYKFQYILCAMYERDIDEITGAMSFQDPRWVNSAEYKKGCETQQWCHYNEMALNDMTSHWEEYAENYLMHIADDMDLETVINFVR